MKTNIAETTDQEIDDIINKMQNIDAEYVDNGYVELNTPFELKTASYFSEEEKKIAGIALYPELLSYYEEEGGWVTIPWICLRLELDEDVSEKTQRELVKWLVEKLNTIELYPFKDEDSFARYSSRDQQKSYTTLKLYLNPSYPKGYWSNHAL